MKIICIGRNYIEHANELNNPIPINPVFFLKPDTCLLQKNQPFFYPDFSNNIQYETELVIRINKVGKYIQKKYANTYYSELTIGIDFTARDIQQQCKEKGLPWEISKAFDNSSPIGNFINKDKFNDIQNINFKLKINNNIVQSGNSKNMIFHIDDIISYVSKYITLKIGDLIFTGTPEGVGPVKIGDHLEAFVENECLLSFNVK